MNDGPHTGQRLRTPFGDVTILGYEVQRDIVVTQYGDWPIEDVRPASPPEDREALEAWLEAGSEWETDTEPISTVVVEILGCKVGEVDCECSSCNLSLHKVRGIVQATYHERWNATCRCEEIQCPCSRQSS